MSPNNVFENIPSELPKELFEELESGKSFRLERIVSGGHVSPPDFWYEQSQHEWVILLRGAARIEFDGDADSVELAPGNYLTIHSGQRHRVVWTDPDEKTVWLAIHFEE